MFTVTVFLTAVSRFQRISVFATQGAFVLSYSGAILSEGHMLFGEL